MTFRKRQFGDLAILGGAPAFEEVLHVGRPNIGDRARLLERFEKILDDRWLTNRGHFVREFEQRVADQLGVRHCIAMCNGTVALEIAIRALGMKGEVIVPSFTFVATAHALQWQEITPVFCDIDPRPITSIRTMVERLITPRTTASSAFTSGAIRATCEAWRRSLASQPAADVRCRPRFRRVT